MGKMKAMFGFHSSTCFHSARLITASAYLLVLEKNIGQIYNVEGIILVLQQRN